MIERDGLFCNVTGMASSTRVEFLVPGDDPVLVNSVRLAIFQWIPHYAFPREKVVIKENTSCRHNDELTHEISTMVVMGLENNRGAYNRFITENPSFLHGNYQAEDGQEDDVQQRVGNDVLSVKLRVMHSDSQTQYKYVTTDDCVFFLNGKTISNPYSKTPMLLLTLREGELIDLEARTEMGVPLRNPLYMCVGNAWFKKEKSGYRFFMDLRPGITGKEVIFRATDLILKRVKTAIVLFHNKRNEEEDRMNKGASNEIFVKGDRLVVPSILTYYLSNHPSVQFSGSKCHHLLGDSSSVYFRASGDVDKLLDDVYKVLEKDLNAFMAKLQVSEK